MLVFNKKMKKNNYVLINKDLGFKKYYLLIETTGLNPINGAPVNLPMC